MAMCVDHTGALLVVSGSGIVDATAGGDLSMATPVITGKPFLSLDCSANRTLAAADGGEIFDVTAGGDFSSAAPFATVPGMPLGVLTTSAGTVYVSVLFQGVFDVTAGGDGELVMPASGFFDAGLAEHQGEVFVASYTQLRRVPSGVVVANGPPVQMASTSSRATAAPCSRWQGTASRRSPPAPGEAGRSSAGHR
jgi:hypothetical protein